MTMASPIMWSYDRPTTRSTVVPSSSCLTSEPSASVGPRSKASAPTCYRVVFSTSTTFWGERAWNHWSREIGKVLPPAEFPIVDVPLEHELFRGLYLIREIPQVPSIQHWRWTGETSERGWESEEPHVRGIFDESGRLMVVMTHNTDIADGWEREGEDEEFFARFSATKAYPMGINIVLYAMTH